MPDKPRPKQRRIRPDWELKPGSRAAFTRGCRCFTIPAFVCEGSREHQSHCPLRRSAHEEHKKEHSPC